MCSIFDVKPLGDDTDLNEMEKVVRAITLDGLTWGPSKFVDIAYGVKKLQISCVVVDDKVRSSFFSPRSLIDLHFRAGRVIIT